MFPSFPAVCLVFDCFPFGLPFNVAIRYVIVNDIVGIFYLCGATLVSIIVVVVSILAISLAWIHM